MKNEINAMVSILKQHREKSCKAAELQLALWNDDKPERQPLLLQCVPDAAENEDNKYFNSKEIHYNPEKMLCNELKGALMSVKAGMEAVPSVRANMGCGIFPTLFGVKQELFEDKMPWVLEHLSKETLSKMGPEDLKISDEFKAGLEHMAYMAQALEGTGCMVYPMDLQGAFDTAHLVYGDQIFYDLYDDPDFIHHILELSCQAIFMGMQECFKIIPGSQARVAHYNSLVMPRSKGGIKISEDTSTLLSKAHIDEFVVPYMHKLLERFGGGYIHYCGRNAHLFEAVMNEPLAYGLNFGNPDKHDMYSVLEACAARDKIYYGLIIKDESEPAEEYFRKCLKASRKDDRSLLLLQYSCGERDRDSIVEAWNRATTC